MPLVALQRAIEATRARAWEISVGVCCHVSWWWLGVLHIYIYVYIYIYTYTYICTYKRMFIGGLHERPNGNLLDYPRLFLGRAPPACFKSDLDGLHDLVNQISPKKNRGNIFRAFS